VALRPLILLRVRPVVRSLFLTNWPRKAAMVRARGAALVVDEARLRDVVTDRRDLGVAAGRDVARQHVAIAEDVLHGRPAPRQ